MKHYAHLLSPGRIGNLSLRNRMVMTAMGTNFGEEDGSAGSRIRDYYVARARGGAGLIISESVSVSFPFGANRLSTTALSEDRHIPGMRAVADAIHAHGAKFAVQLNHNGPKARQDMVSGRPVWTPSVPAGGPSEASEAFLADERELAFAPIAKAGGARHHVMSVDDIGHIVGLFAAAAGRAKEAGADGVEIHGGHGYLISSFLSPHTNHRTDDYGGSVENRSRLLVEIVRAARRVVGPDFPLWCKIDGREYLIDDGITVPDAIRTALLLQEAGICALTVSGYADPARNLGGTTGSHTPEEPSLMLPSAIAIRAALKIPVITAGRIDLAVADSHIGAGKFDFLAMGRKLLADPDVPRKVALGRPQDIRPCVYCYTCVSQLGFDQAIRCAVNPETGFEAALAPIAAPVKKRVAVVGGGPAGMEAARRLALRGHDVTLFERTASLGGALQLASIAYAANEGLLAWLRAELARSAVKVRLNTVATAGLLKSLAPDVVVVAVGAARETPPIPGGDLPHVFSADDMRQLLRGGSARIGVKIGSLANGLLALASAVGAMNKASLVRAGSRAWIPLGKQVVVIGGELVGLELAEFLSERGRQVTVLEQAPKMGAGLQVLRRQRVLSALQSHHVVLQAGIGDIRIGEKSVSYTTARGQRRAIPATHVIVAQGARPDAGVAQGLEAQGLKVFSIGDCKEIGYIEGAMRSAANLAAGI